jgi:2-aminoadipate transaminase
MNPDPVVLPAPSRAATFSPDSAAPVFRFARRTAHVKPSAIREILKTTVAPEIISFAGGLPAPELFPVESIAAAAQHVLTHDGPAALQYSTTEGHRPLREWVCRHLGETVGFTPSPDDVLITSGSQQGLDLVARALLDPGDTVLVENPAYVGALQAIQASEANIIGLPADDEGMLPAALDHALRSAEKRPKLIYLIPNFQNPTGTSLSLERRTLLAAIAAHHGVPILEDDPYGRLRYTGDHLPAISSLPGGDHCVYLGTTSKIMAPGLRVAWLVTRDRALREQLVTLKQSSDLHTSSFAQAVAHRWLTQPGALDAHLEKLCATYARRRDTMLAALARHLPAGCTWTQPAGGLFLWARLPEKIDTLQLLRAATQQKIAFVPGAPFWVGEPQRNTLRLNFSNASEANIDEGIRRLGEVVCAALLNP